MITLRKANQRGYSYVLDWSEGGKRKRRFFLSQNAAQVEKGKIAARLSKFVTGEAPVTPDEHRAIVEARGAGFALMDAVIHYKKTIAAHGGRTLAEIADTREAIVKAEKDAGHITEHYFKCVERVLKKAREQLGAMPAANVTAQECQAFLAGWTGHHSQKQARAVLGSVFTHAQRMGWLQVNPAAALLVARKKVTAGIPIFTPAEAREWLDAVAAKAPSCLAGWAIAMFAGLRSAEVQRLDWSEVKLDRLHIEVTAQKSKTRTRRLVTIQPNLAAILAPLAGEGPVFPLSPKRAEAHARKAYGRPLPKNVARHSFVSYHLVKFGDLKSTELEAGHDRKVLFQHYRELVTRADAEAYFSLTARCSGPGAISPDIAEQAAT